MFNKTLILKGFLAFLSLGFESARPIFEDQFFMPYELQIERFTGMMVNEKIPTDPKNITHFDRIYSEFENINDEHRMILKETLEGSFLQFNDLHFILAGDFVCQAYQLYLKTEFAKQLAEETEKYAEKIREEEKKVAEKVCLCLKDLHEVYKDEKDAHLKRQDRGAIRIFASASLSMLSKVFPRFGPACVGGYLAFEFIDWLKGQGWGKK